MPDFVQFLAILIAVIFAIGITGAIAQALRARLTLDASGRIDDTGLAALESRIVARLEARLRALEHAIDAAAIEVERIGGHSPPVDETSWRRVGGRLVLGGTCQRAVRSGGGRSHE